MIAVTPKMKSTIAFALNTMVNVPLLSEKQEQKVAEKLIDMCLDPFERAFPDSFVDEMVESGETSKENLKDKIRGQVVDNVNKCINFPFINEEQEAKAIGIIVDYFIIAKLNKIDKLIN